MYPHSRAAARGGEGCSRRRSLRVVCDVCGARGVLWPFVSGVSRGLAASAYSSLPLLWHRHARRCMSPGEGRRAAAAVCTSAFWTFWSSCTAVMSCTAPECDRGSAWGGGGKANAAVKGGGVAHIDVGEAARAATRAAATHRLVSLRLSRERVGWGGIFPAGEGGESTPGALRGSALRGKACGVRCDVQKQLCPAARGKGRPQGSSRQQWVWVSW